MRTCTFCLSTNQDDAPYCAFCGRSGPPASGAAPPMAPPPTWGAPPPPASAPMPIAMPAPTPFAGPGSMPAPMASPDEATGRGPLVLVVTSAVAALLLVLAAYLGSIATPAAEPLKQERGPLAPVAVPDGVRGW